MPAKNIRKVYLENSYYHIYNRGVEKRKIFLDQQDYSVFLNYLKDYILPKDEKNLSEIVSNEKIPWSEKEKAIKLLRLNNFSGQITVLAYCLMPNHFHFFVKQKEADSIDRFMNSICTRYTMYFNKKNDRVGSLYQGTYKAVRVMSEDQFLHLSRYIHRQAISLQGHTLKNQPSSYQDYLGEIKTEWVKSDEVLSYFSVSNPNLSYKSFMKQEDDFEKLQDIILEND